MSRGRSQQHARFSARAASLRAASLRRRLALAGGVVLVLVLVWTVWFSPLLAVRSVQIAGAEDELAGKVRMQADDQVGRPLLRVDTAGIAGGVERLAEVRSVEVSRGWPNTLEVQVSPRTPVVVVDRAGKQRLVDGAGVEYASASAKDARGLPVVKLGEGQASGSDVAAVARVMAAVPSRERDQVENLRVSSIGHVSFSIDGLRVAWGDSSKSQAKGKALATMRPIADKEGRSRLDISSPKRPVLS